MNTDDENQARTQPSDPQRERKAKRSEPGHEPHPHQPRRISQEDMQKIMPPNPDPDDPQSP